MTYFGDKILWSELWSKQKVSILGQSPKNWKLLALTTQHKFSSASGGWWDHKVSNVKYKQNKGLNFYMFSYEVTIIGHVVFITQKLKTMFLLWKETRKGPIGNVKSMDIQWHSWYCLGHLLIPGFRLILTFLGFATLYPKWHQARDIFVEISDQQNV